MIHLTLTVAALYGALAVILGAFGTHALSPHQSEKSRGTWRTAERFNFYHALALLAVGLLMHGGMAGAALTVSAWCFMAGTLLFSGGLYLLSATGKRFLGAATPAGGALLIIGWIALIAGVY